MDKVQGDISDQGVELGAIFKKGVKGTLCPFCQGKKKMWSLFIEKNETMLVDCPICEGRGFVDHPNACYKCHGTGTETGDMMYGPAEVECRACHGTGRFI